MDHEGLLRAVNGRQADAVVHVLTALPKNGPMQHRDMYQTDALRDACTRADRMLLVLLARLVRTWQQALLTAVTAIKDSNIYATGIKVSDDELAALNLSRDAFHGVWNYTIKPQGT